MSYCDRIVWEGAYDRLPDALRWLRREKGIGMPVVCQYHRNPRDQGRHTASYQAECWRLAGRLEQFATRGPLVFDLRSEGMESDLTAEYMAGLPIVLVGLSGVSSPLQNSDAILRAVQGQFSVTHRIIDLSTFRAQRIFDVLGLMDVAECLVSSDTVWLHLARASKVPLVALINNGWRGSVVDDANAVIRYEAATPEAVVEAVRRIVEPKDTLTSVIWPRPGITPDQLAEIGLASDGKGSVVCLNPDAVIRVKPERLETMQRIGGPRIYHAYDPCGTEPRHLKAQASWKALYEAEGIIGRPFPRGGRDAKLTIKDPRPLPYLKDIIEAGIPADALDSDIVAWGNSDVGFSPGIGAALRRHIGEHQCAAMRRTESNGRGHPGRDLVAFTVGWWRANAKQFPDYIIGAPIFDLGIVALFRQYHKLPALTLKGLSDDLHPADMAPGFALHESHEPEWQVVNVDNVPSVRHNRAEFVKWAKKNCPEIKFTKGGNLL